MTDRPGHVSRGRRQGGAAATAADSTRYVDLRRFHVRSGLRVSHVWRILSSQDDLFLGSEGKTLSQRPRGRFIAWLQRIRRVAAMTLRYLQADRRASQASALELPVAGELALVRRSGAVKVLDIGRGRVLTVMQGPEWRAKLEARVESMRRLAGVSVAPQVLEVALDQGWLAEEFLRGRHPTGFQGCLEAFDRTYLPLLTAFLSAEQPQMVDLEAYAMGLAEEILAPDSLLARLPTEASDDVRGFVADVRRRLTDGGGLGRRRLPLVLSHGDFFSGNVVVPDEGPPRAIDWAHVGSRSPVHDLYFLVMNHCVRVMSPDQQRRRLREMLDAVRSRLAIEDPPRFELLDQSLTSEPELRQVFYLECIQTPLERCDDPTDRYITSMLHRIARFREYERAPLP